MNNVGARPFCIDSDRPIRFTWPNIPFFDKMPCKTMSRKKATDLGMHSRIGIKGFAGTAWEERK